MNNSITCAPCTQTTCFTGFPSIGCAHPCTWPHPASWSVCGTWAMWKATNGCLVPKKGQAVGSSLNRHWGNLPFPWALCAFPRSVLPLPAVSVLEEILQAWSTRCSHKAPETSALGKSVTIHGDRSLQSLGPRRADTRCSWWMRWLPPEALPKGRQKGS